MIFRFFPHFLCKFDVCSKIYLSLQRKNHSTMKRLTIIVLFVIFLPFYVGLQAQQMLVTSQYNERHYGITDGLPTQMVECVFQDSRGFLWFGTEHGAARFDGYTFKTFLSDKSFPVNKIEENEKGDIVIYGYHFIYLIDNKTDKLKLILNNDNINYCVDKSPGLPTGYSLYTKRNEKQLALFHLKNDTLTECFSHPALSEMDYGQSIFYDTAEQLFYIPTANGKIHVISADGKERNVINNIYACRFIKNKSELFAVGYDGVWAVTPTETTLKLKFPKNIISKEESIAATIDTDGNFIICDAKSVRRFINNRFETILDNVNIPRSLLFDKEGNLWFTSRQGVYNFFKLDGMTYKMNAQAADIVNSIVPVKAGEIFFATGEGKLIRYKNGDFTNVVYPALPDVSANSFSFKSIKIDESIFFTTFNDIIHYKNGVFRRLNIPPEIYHNASCRLNKDEFVVGGGDKLAVLSNNGHLLRVIEQSALRGQTIYTVQVDNQNRLWLGGYKGICCIDATDSLYFFNENTMNAQASDKDVAGRVWFTADSRLFFTDGDSLHEFMKFPNTVLNNLCCTQNNLLVVSDNAGVKIIDPGTKKVVNYDFTNGFSCGEPAWNTMTEDFDGNIWLGTQSANVLKFNPLQFIKHSYKPLFYITSAQFSVNNIDMHEMQNGAALIHNEHNVRFSFVGLCFSDPQNVRYYYRLKGFQNEYTQASKEREVSFNNLPAGDYIFEAYADCGNKESKSNTLSFAFTIKPAFWQTWWFAALSILAFAICLAAFIVIIFDKKHKKNIAKIVREKEMNELLVQSIRLKSIPHFNANVLSGIEYYILKKSKKEANELLTQYSRFTNTTLHDIDRAQRTLKEELEYVRLYLELEKMRFGDNLSYSIEIEEDMDTTIIIPNMVLHTYAENAVKHGIRGKNGAGIIKIKAEKLEKGIIVSVEDNGIGRQEARRRNIEHNGLGLSILSRQIELYNQNNKEKIVQTIIDLRNADGSAAGTRFELYVPYDYKFL